MTGTRSHPTGAAGRAGRSRGLILCVIDAMAPAMLEQTVALGRAPVLGELMRSGHYVGDCVAAFPSVTPVCAASIATGTGPDRHMVPGMNWYRREEGRYIEYGSSLRAAQRFGIARQLTDTVYNMNADHLSARTPTIFERLDDVGLRTACTTYLIYRGRHRHEPRRDSPLARLTSTLMRRAVMGPEELYYADIFASRSTGCRSTLGMPAVRDRHSGCVGAYLTERDLFDFLLLSLPDNDWHSHKRGVEAQVDSIELADEQLARVAAAAGGLQELLERYAVIVMADHSQTPIVQRIDLRGALADLDVLPPTSRGRSQRPRIAVCPSQRAAMVYVLEESERDPLRTGVVGRSMQLTGIDLAMWLERDPHGVPREAVVRSPERGELRFAPGPEAEDARGGQWSIEGSLAVLAASREEGLLSTPDYPDALARIWAALMCESAGDVLLSAAPGHEFMDWGGQAHIGGGSHGSLHRCDSLGALILHGVESLPARHAGQQLEIRSGRGPGPEAEPAWGEESIEPGWGARASGVPETVIAAPATVATGGEPSAVPWTIADVAPIVAAHFGLPPSHV